MQSIPRHFRMGLSDSQDGKGSAAGGLLFSAEDGTAFLETGGDFREEFFFHGNSDSMMGNGVRGDGTRVQILTELPFPLVNCHPSADVMSPSSGPKPIEWCSLWHHANIQTWSPS